MPRNNRLNGLNMIHETLKEGLNRHRSTAIHSQSLISYTKCHFYARMDWWEVVVQPRDFEDLPSAFAQAKSLWDKSPEKNMYQILDLISPGVCARFIPSNITGWEELFVDCSGNGIIDIQPIIVNLQGVDFSRSPLPISVSEAIFEVEVTPIFASIDHDFWQSAHSGFTDGVVFYWDFPRTKNTHGIDYVSGNFQSAECYVI